MRSLIAMTLVTSILITVLLGALVVTYILEPPVKSSSSLSSFSSSSHASHTFSNQEFINTATMSKNNSSLTLSDPESVYSKIYALQQEKIARNRKLGSFRRQKEEEEKQYKKDRENWVRYIDGELIKGYDPRYDKIFDSGDIYLRRD